MQPTISTRAGFSVRVILAALVALSLAAASAAAAPAPWPPAPPDTFDGLAAAVRAHASDPRALAWLYRLEALADVAPGPDPLPAVLADVLGDRRAPPWLRDGARWLRLRGALRAGDAGEAARWRAELGVPTDWAVVGPFDNLGNRAFGVDLGPEADGFAGIAEGRIYEGRSGPAPWRFLPGAGAIGGLDLQGLFEDTEDGELAAYAATGFTLDRTRPLELRVGSADSVEVWVDGVWVLARDVRRDAFPDQEVLPLTVPAGRHVVVAKICRQRRPWQLVVRVTAPGGGALAGLVFATEATALAPPGRVAVRAGELRAPEPLRGLRSRVPAEGEETAADVALLAAATRLERLVHPDDASEERSLRLAERALAAAPDEAAVRAPLHLALAETVRDDDRRRASLEAAVETARAAGDRATEATALDALVERYDRRRESTKAVQYVAALTAVDPGHPRVLMHRARAIADAGAHDLALAGVRALVIARPRYLPALRLGAELARGVRDPVLEFQLAGARLARDARDRAARGRYLNLSARTPGASAADLLVDAVAADPYDLPLRVQRLRALAREGRLDEAERTLAADRSIYPNSHTLDTFAGDLALRRSDDDGARRAFQASLERNPQQRDLQHRLAYHAEGGAAPAADAADRERLRAFAATPVTPECGIVGACVLSSSALVDVRPNGLASRTVEHVVRVVDRRMRDGLRSFPIPYVPDEHRLEVEAALRLGTDGRISGPTATQTSAPRGREGGVYTRTHRRVVSFDDLAAGDVVLVRYRIEDVVVRNPFGSFFGDIHTFSTPVPTVSATYELRVPATRPLHTFEQGVPAPSIEERGETQVYRWEAHDLPAIVWEPRSPGYPEIGAYASVSTFGDWQALNDWYVDLVREQREIDDPIRRVVHSLTDGVDDPRERVRRVYGWVITNTRYVGIEFGIHGFKPYSVTQVFQRGYGDCKDKSFLLSAMLVEAGVDATPALLRTRDRGLLAVTPATLWAFNHVITYVPSLDLWLDPTAEYAGSDALHPLDQDAMALIVRDGGAAALVRTPTLPADANADTTEIALTLTARGDGRMGLRETMTGHLATAARQLLHDASRRTERLERVLGETFPGATVSDLVVEGVETPEEPVRVSAAVAIPGAARASVEGLRTRLVVLPTGLGPLAAQSDRRHDLILDHTRLDRTVARIVPPVGHHPVDVPESGDVDSPFGRYSIAIRTDGSALVVESTLRMDVIRVAAADFPAFRRFCLEVDALERRTVTFAVDAAAAGPVPASVSAAK